MWSSLHQQAERGKTVILGEGTKRPDGCIGVDDISPLIRYISKYQMNDMLVN
jgi:hypothetical protein